MKARSVLLLMGSGCVAIAGISAEQTTPLQRAPASAARLANPFEGSERAAKAGAKLYGRECAACHGKSAEGVGRKPPLNRVDVRDAPPGALFWVLRNGSIARGMPSFAHLPEPQRWQIITYLRSLSRGPMRSPTDAARKVAVGRD